MQNDDNIAPVMLTVTGDSTADWVLVIPDTTENVPVQIRAHPGGAPLLTLGIAAALDHQSGAIVSGPVLPETALNNPDNDRLTRTYSIWQPYPVETDSKKLVWRMHRYLGMTRPSDPESLDTPVDNDQTTLIIDDANLGFRSTREAWPAWLSAGNVDVRHVLLKTSHPIGDGPLWDQLVNHYRDVLTVYCSVDDLRKEYASIGQSLSWERTASEVVQAVSSRKNLSLPQRLIVSLGFSGAVIIEQHGPATLIFDPRNQENDWERRHPGLPVGIGTCVVAALATAVAANPSDPAWDTGVRHGLLAARMIHDDWAINHSTPDGSAFPLHQVGQALAGELPDETFRTVHISEDPDWHISSVVSIDDFRTIAARIVVEGDQDACQDIPTERIGSWTSIDRIEIESMRSARGIAREYLQQSNPSRPLSLAVFGPPGSGKSFAIKQMTREPTSVPRDVKVLEFNLSQFKSPDDLPHAFQAIRDCAVEQTLPLVFWDEFDTALDGAELGWVSRFLSPMQDGVFSDNGISRPIGPAIFIFAGGTHSTMASFKNRAIQIPEAKATDFLSRLRGYLDILGPNPMSDDDQSFVLRRALLLRGLLSGKVPGVRHRDRIDIDPGVLRAFLDVSTYIHGARSMESIIDMSALSGRLRYERSALPPMNQLGLHVDPDEFLELVHREG